jgi:hypothetical protein
MYGGKVQLRQVKKQLLLTKGFQVQKTKSRSGGVVALREATQGGYASIHIPWNRENNGYPDSYA